MEEYPVVQPVTSDGEAIDVKNTEEQKEWMKKILLNYRPDATNGDIESLWSRVMVGFFSESVPSGGGTGDVRRVVCSPDLPLPAASAPSPSEENFRAATSSANAANTLLISSAKLENVDYGSATHIRNEPPGSQRIPNTNIPAAPVSASTNGMIKEQRDDPYQCNVCHKTFAVPARLTRHYRTHTGERPFQCDFCDKKFGVKENLSVHRRIHTKERPYKCEVCARAFEHSGKLHRHMRIHTGERPHACAVCNKTFIQSGQLVIHMRTHTGEKPYVCPVCDKGFTCSKQLKVHSRTHTGEKPYNCDICGKSFGYNHVLKLHQVAHYGQKVYKCTICLDTFTSKKTMEAHIKTHSENNVQTPNEHPEVAVQNSQESMIIANESSCTSDKENKDLTTSQTLMEHSNIIPQQTYYVNPRTITSSDSRFIYLQSSNSSPTTGVNPALLAAATAAAREDLRPQSLNSPPQATTSPYINYTPADLRHSVSASYFPQQLDTTPQRLDRGNEIRRRVEAALAAAAAVDNTCDDLTQITPNERIATPPSSTHSTSPSPSLSPDPMDEHRQVLILPPRKRSKAILKSMELRSLQQSGPPTVRYNSVIQYAGTS